MELTSKAFHDAAHPELLDRDHSLVAFNERVLSWAAREDVPVLERLRYLCIVSSNLDEFFEVRSEPHLTAKRSGDKQGSYTEKSFDRLSQSLHALVDRQYGLYNDAILPALAHCGIKIVSHGERNAEQRLWVKQYFEREVRPLLIPVGLDPAHPFPQVANKALNFIVRLGGNDAFGRSNEIAIVKVPRVLPRIIRMPDRVSGTKVVFVALTSVIRAHLSELFAGRTVDQFSQFRVTRHSDLAVDEDDVQNLRMALRQGLVHRHYGEAVRLEVSSGCSEHLSHFLLKQFDLPAMALYRVSGPVNLVRLTQMIDLLDRPELCFPAYRAAPPVQLDLGANVFEQLKQGDVITNKKSVSTISEQSFINNQMYPLMDSIKETITNPKYLVQEAALDGWTIGGSANREFSNHLPNNKSF